jgi:hypothetical protein
MFKRAWASNVTTNLMVKAAAPAVIEYHSMKIAVNLARSRYLLMERRVHDAAQIHPASRSCPCWLGLMLFTKCS